VPFVDLLRVKGNYTFWEVSVETYVTGWRLAADLRLPVVSFQLLEPVKPPKTASCVGVKESKKDD
jgi:hypothetical protein